ncbi:hypothetical protein EMCRGX_G015920 [Ephydatia muelleri]
MGYCCYDNQAIYLVGTALYKFLNWLAYLGALYNQSWWLALDRSATKVAGRHPVTIGPAMVDNQEDADSLCCYQCRGAIIIRWQGTRARSVATWALCSQAQRYYKHVQRAHGDPPFQGGAVVYQKDFDEVLLTTRKEEAKRKEYEHMQEKEAFRQEMLEESKEREALMAVQLRRECQEDLEPLKEEILEWRQKWEERRENTEKMKEGRTLTEVQRRLFRTPTSPLTQPHPPQPVPQPSPLLGMVEIEDPILQEVEEEEEVVEEVAQVEEEEEVVEEVAQVEEHHGRHQMRSPHIGKNATPGMRDHTSPVEGNDMVPDIPCVRGGGLVSINTGNILISTV